MRFATLLATTLLAGAAAAQISIPPWSSNYTGFTRGFCFTSATSFYIVGLDLPTDNYAPGDTSAYVVTVNGVVVYNTRGNTGSVSTCIPVVNGDSVFIYGNWTTGVGGSFTAKNSYSASVSGFATTIEGVPHTIYRTGWQWDIGDPTWVSTGATGTSLGQVTTGSLGRILVTTSLTGCGGVLASNTTLGAGCIGSVGGFNSFYQYFADSAAASAGLQGNSLLLIPNGNGAYDGAWLPGTAAANYVPPASPTVLTCGDDGVVTYSITSGPLNTPQGPQTSVQVSGNGIVAWGSGTMDYPLTNAYTPTAGGFLNSLLGGVYVWHDYNSAEAGSGPIQAEEIGGVLYITYNGVENYANPEVANPSRLQFQLNLASGLIQLVFPLIDNNNTSVFGSAYLVGVTSPGASSDPGSINLATATASQLHTVNPEVLPVVLSAGNRPIQMATPNAWNLTVSNIPPAGTVGLEIFGLTDPNVPDLFFLGMPGCGIRASLDVVNAWVVLGSPTHSYSLAIPTTPVLNNVHVYTNAAVLVPGANSFLGGTITTNGIDGKIGNL